MIIKCKVCSKEFYLRPATFKRGTRCCSMNCANKILKRKSGKNHHNWKGNNVGYGALHTFIKSKKKKPSQCEICGIKTNKLDLANKSQKYRRILSDWEYICRKCHMRKDGRILTFRLNVKPKQRVGKMMKCFICNNMVYRKPSEILTYNKVFCSRKCLGKNMNNIRWSSASLIG